jgi:hypothetical protein
VAVETVVDNKANNISVAEANEANEANKAGEAEAVDEAEADLANDAADTVEAVGAGAANRTNASVVTNKVDASVLAYDVKATNVDETDKADKVGNKLGELLMAVVVLILVFSLTKYSVIFTEVEGDFAKNINNQLK